MTEEIPDIPAFIQQMGTSILTTSLMLDTNKTAEFLARMEGATRVFVAGSGRSGFVARAFAMRLMHLGYTVYMAGETTTPAVRKGDTLVVFSGSGTTGALVSICTTVKNTGGTVCLITASPKSRMSRQADCVVNLGDLTAYYPKADPSPKVPEVTDDVEDSPAFAPLGTLFETLAWVFSDAVISALMILKEVSPVAMQGLHANI
jgi:6-phospho-3-hexuloisomerase